MVSPNVKQARLSVAILAVSTVTAWAVALSGPLIDGWGDDSPTCLERVADLDGLSPRLKRLYAEPGPPPEGVPKLASPSEEDDWNDCGGNPEVLLEEEAGN